MRSSLLGLFVLSALASPSQAQSAPRVFIVGDSHVQMLGPLLGRALAQGGYQLVGWEARHGWSTERYLREGHLRRLLEAHGRPEIVVVLLGGNDHVRSPDEYRVQLGAIVNQVRAAGGREIVWLGPASSDRARAASTEVRHGHNADLQGRLLPQLGVHWIDSRPFTTSHYRPDGVHFTRIGYRAWSTRILPGVVAATGS